ncbi:hypothetical protein P3T18_002491 [Paraburkholderia sp. GAS199]
MIFGTGSKVFRDFYNKLFRDLTKCRHFYKKGFRINGVGGCGNAETGSWRRLRR